MWTFLQDGILEVFHARELFTPTGVEVVCKSGVVMADGSYNT